MIEIQELIKQKEHALKIAKERDGSYFSGRGTKRIHTKREQHRLEKEIRELQARLEKGETVI